jgi:molybdopterin adenylyltransferase
VLATPFEVEERLIADEQPVIESALAEPPTARLRPTTGGTGARRDARSHAVAVMPGFGEQMFGHYADRDPLAAVAIRRR